MLHALANAATIAILAVLIGAVFFVVGYWPRIRAALKGNRDAGA
jgi:uncharacterized membrane protein YiaA